MKKRLPLLKEQIANNWVYKVVALLVALSIWVTTYENKKEIMRSRDIKISFLAGANRALEGAREKILFVKVIGAKIPVKRYIQSTPAITMDLSDMGAGLKQIEVRPADLNIPNGVRLLSVEPPIIEVNIKEVQ